jgi:hypothetical protein
MSKIISEIKSFFKRFNLFDSLVNNWLLLRNRLLFFILRKKTGSFRIPKKLKVSYSDDFCQMSVEELDSRWIRKQHWGNYHPNDLQQWYDPKAVNLTTSGLHLSVTQNKLKIQNGEIQNGVGLVTSKTPLSYGYYRWTFQLPKGPQLWPAIWLSHYKTWPPEIDVFEGYSDWNSKFGKHINTNIHLGNSSETHYGLGAFRNGFLVPKDSDVVMELHWTKKSIKIYYNHFLVRVITDGRHLRWFNQDPNMWVILNNALRVKIGPDWFLGARKDFIIKKFEYFYD